MNQEEIIRIIEQILERQGKLNFKITSDFSLKDISFRSLDFSELCLRVEDEINKELKFEAADLRKITTVQEVTDFIINAIK